MKLSQSSDGRLTRDALDQMFHVDTKRRRERRAMLTRNKERRVLHLAAKRAETAAAKR